MVKLGAILRLTRFEHSLMLIVAVVAAELLSGGIPQAPIALLSIVTPVFLSMSAFAVNDYFDIKVDRENGKKRPLVTGELKPSDALNITIITMAIGLIGGLFINWYCFAIALIFGAISLLYSYRLKEIPLLGNAYVALSMAIPFIFGDYVVSRTLLPVIVLVFFLVFVSGLGREIDGTIRDFRGDRKRKALTLPMLFGIRPSAYLGFFLYVAAIEISIHLYLAVAPFMGNLVYGVPILVSDAMLLYSGVVFTAMQSKSYGLVRNVSLAAMGLALVGILISSVVYL